MLFATVIQFILNNEVSSETGLSPFEFTFGTAAKPYFKLPDNCDILEGSATYISKFNVSALSISLPSVVKLILLI